MDKDDLNWANSAENPSARVNAMVRSGRGDNGWRSFWEEERRGSRASRVNQINARTRQSTTPTAYGQVAASSCAISRPSTGTKKAIFAAQGSRLQLLATTSGAVRVDSVHVAFVQRSVAQSAIVSAEKRAPWLPSSRNTFRLWVIACVERIASRSHTEQ